MNKLKQYYEAAGFDCGKKEYIDNCEIRVMLEPVVRLLMAKRKEAEKQGKDAEAMIYINTYMNISLDAGITLARMAELFDKSE